MPIHHKNGGQQVTELNASTKGKTLYAYWKDADGNIVTDANGRLYAANVFTSSDNVATVNFNRNKKRTLKASPVLTDGSISTVEGWINNASGFDWN